jgi:exonuclease VII small subunit
MSHIQALENEIVALKEEFEKFERGNKSAGTRARKVLQNIKRISQDIRVHIQTNKKSESPKKEG